MVKAFKSKYGRIGYRSSTGRFRRVLLSDLGKVFCVRCGRLFIPKKIVDNVCDICERTVF